MSKTILIDRGHSYSAPGAAGYASEVALTHKWGEAIYNKVTALGGRAILLNDGATAATDLSTPVKQANAYGKDSVFLSVHANAGPEGATGSEIFAYKGAYKGETKTLTDAVYAAFRTVVPELRDRGVKQADYYVLRETVMSACLLELAFVTNNSDAVVISDETIINKGAEAIAKALMNVAGQQIVVPEGGNSVLEEGFYVITSKQNGKAIDLNKSTMELAVYDRHGGTNQQWIYVNGYFKSVENGLVMDIASGSKENGAPVICYDATGGANQKFDISVSGEIIARHSGKRLDIAGGSNTNGAKIIQYTANGGTNQKWNFERIQK